MTNTFLITIDGMNIGKGWFDMKEHFPLFISSRGKKVLVVGGGKIATRRILTLTNFEFEITVVAPNITNEIQQLADDGLVTHIQREFRNEDLDGKFLVVAATDKREINKYIGEKAKELGAYVSVADVKEECNFYFPAVIVKDENCCRCYRRRKIS